MGTKSILQKQIQKVICTNVEPSSHMMAVLKKITKQTFFFSLDIDTQHETYII